MKLDILSGLPCFLGLCILLLGCNPRELPGFKKLAEATEREITRQTEEAIKNDPILQDLDNVCQQVPLPEEFEFARRGGLDDETISLSSHYFSDMKYEEVRKVWEEYFFRNGWELVRHDVGMITVSSEFRRPGYRVLIEHQPGQKPVMYSINCEKLRQ